MKNKFENKVVVITGASSGIGYSIAKLLFSKGCKVYDISKTLVKHNEIVEGFECDVNNISQVDEILQKIFEKEGKINVFINNAGFGIAGAIEDTKYENIYIYGIIFIKINPLSDNLKWLSLFKKEVLYERNI